MAKRSLLSTSARRALVIDYINRGLVASQSDLVDLLADEGIEVTQATASRDLDEVGAVRGKDESGRVRYRLVTAVTGSNAKLGRVSNELMLSVTSSGNLVVVKTPPGGAQLLASSLDRAAARGDLTNLIGTIAGDDTVLAISRSATGGRALAEDLKGHIEIAGKRRKGAS